MKDKFFAVIDTNVIVSALISKNIDSNPGKVFRAIVQERIVPLYNDEILAEYRCVLSRPKFHLSPDLIETVLKAIIVDFPDPKDIVFYEIAISKENAYLVTGNIKHFPVRSFIVSPAEMVEILGED